MPPFFSVIMACHNAEPYVYHAITSVREQTFSDFELVFVDDFSTDDSLEIATELSKIDKRIRVFKIDKLSGPGATRNFAISKAKGDWLAVLDADDKFLPDKLEIQKEIILNAGPRLVLLGSGSFHIDENGKRLGKYIYPVSSASLKKNLWKRKKFPPHSSIIYRASSVNELGCFNPKFLRSQDYELWLRLSEIGDFVSCRLPLIEYRKHSTSISNSLSNDGFSQLEYGTAARVCQMLRQSGYLDPSTTNDPELWDKFMKHISNSIRDLNYHGYLQWKSKYKEELQRQDNQLLNSLFLNARTIFDSPHFCINLLKEYIKGNGLANICYRTWKF